jgi:hypothetical protein
MSKPINMVQLVKNLPTRPRGRACIVLTHDFTRQKDWAAALAQKTHSEHINLLDLFVQDKSLSEKVSHFLVPELFDFLKNRSQAPVLIVSGLEFLKAPWAGQAKVMEQFASQVETWNNSPSLLFVLQYDKTLANHTFRRFRQYTFVIDQKETLAL